MQPVSQSIEYTLLAKILSPTSDKLFQMSEDKYFPANMFEKSRVNKISQSKENSPDTKQSNLSQAINHYQNESQLPQILDIAKTQQTQQRHSILKHTINSTIMQILNVYKNRNTVLSTDEQQRIKNEIFQRFAFIYSEMNEVKGNIENVINFLNEGANLTSREKNTPIKKMHLPHQKITEKSQSFEESSSMKEEENQANNQEQSDQNYGQASLQERYQEKSNQNHIESEE